MRASTHVAAAELLLNALAEVEGALANESTLRE